MMSGGGCLHPFQDLQLIGVLRSPQSHQGGPDCGSRFRNERQQSFDGLRALAFLNAVSRSRQRLDQCLEAAPKVIEQRKIGLLGARRRFRAEQSQSIIMSDHSATMGSTAASSSRQSFPSSNSKQPLGRPAGRLCFPPTVCFQLRKFALSATHTRD